MTTYIVLSSIAQPLSVAVNFSLKPIVLSLELSEFI